jgi:hypothetical protein
MLRLFFPGFSGAVLQFMLDQGLNLQPIFFSDKTFRIGKAGLFRRLLFYTDVFYT